MTDQNTDDSTDAQERAKKATRVAVSTDYKVRGKDSLPGGASVVGHNTASSGNSYGVEGVSDADGNSSNGELPAGVHGATSGPGVTRGVFGEADTPSGRGVVGTANKNSGIQHTTDPGFPAGVWGTTDQSTADGLSNAFGVVGQATATSGTAYGTLGFNASPEGYGVMGEDISGSPDAWGLYSRGDSKTEGDHEVTGIVKRNATTKVFLSSTQTIPDGTNTKVAFDSTNDTLGSDTAGDDFGAFDTTNHEYVVPRDGDYRVDVNLSWANSLGEKTVRSVDLVYDGYVEARWIREVPPNSGDTACIEHGTTVLKNLTEGNSFYINVSQDSGSSRDLAAFSYETNLSVTHVG